MMHAGAPELGVRWLDDQVDTIYAVDVNGETVLVIVESGSIGVHAGHLEVTQPIIDSLQFTPRT